MLEQRNSPFMPFPLIPYFSHKSGGTKPVNMLPVISNNSKGRNLSELGIFPKRALSLKFSSSRVRKYPILSIIVPLKRKSFNMIERMDPS